MKSFLRDTAEQILQQTGWDKLRHLTLVLPSRRAGVMLQSELLALQKESGQKAVFAPKVQTLRQFIDSLSPLYAEDELTTIARLYRHYCQNDAGSDHMPLDLFYGWGRQMIADFTNVDASMTQAEVPNFFDNTIAAHVLEQLVVDKDLKARLTQLIDPLESTRKIDQQAMRRRYERMWEALYKIYAALREEMLKEGKGYEGLRARRVVEEWDTILPTLQDKQFVFVGFNYLLPVEKKIMELLKDANKAVFYWDYVADFNANAKAFAFTRENCEDLSGTPKGHPWGETRPVNLIACASAAAQSQYVNQWLREHYTQQGQKVAVVICDEGLLEPVIYALPPLTVKDKDGKAVEALVNITKGFPLRNTQAFAQVIRATEQWKKEIDWQLLYDKLDELAETANNDESIELNAVSNGPSKQYDWHHLLAEESAFQVRTCVNKMRHLVNKGVEGVNFTPKLVRLLLRRQMESITMPFHGEPVTDVQVLGVLETRLLDFDHVLLLNVEEGVLPQQQHDISFIPYYLRKTYHMQTSDERATVYAYNFFRLLSRAGQITMLYTSAEANKDSRGLSRFGFQMLASPEEFNITKLVMAESAQIAEINRFDLVDKQWDEDKISPSALNTYIECPRKFYFQQVEKYQTEDKEEAVFAPNVLGSFVHALLRYFYEEYMGCKAPKDEQGRPQYKWTTIDGEKVKKISDDDAQMQQALKAAYDAMNQDWEKHHPGEENHYIPEQHYTENQTIIRYARYVLERDSRDATEHVLQIYLMEGWRNKELKLDETKTIKFGGYIDRIDKIGEQIRIVDYKSGSASDEKLKKKMATSKEEWFTSTDANYIRQTLMYCAAVDSTGDVSKLQPNLYFCSRPMLDLPTKLSLDGQEINDFSEIKDDFEEKLKETIQAIRNDTEFPQQDPEKKCSKYCPFLDFCGREAMEF